MSVEVENTFYKFLTKFLFKYTTNKVQKTLSI